MRRDSKMTRNYLARKKCPFPFCLSIKSDKNEYKELKKEGHILVLISLRTSCRRRRRRRRRRRKRRRRKDENEDEKYNVGINLDFRLFQYLDLFEEGKKEERIRNGGRR